MKTFGLFAIVMLALVMFAGSVAAQDFVTIDRVEVNDQVADQFSPVFLEREQEVVVEVFFTGNPYGPCTSGDSNTCYSTRVEAELEGWEGGDVRDVEGPFEVEPGVQYRKVLRFTLPEDMPASDDLTLFVEVKNNDELVMVTFPVRVQEMRHRVNVFDVIFNPVDNVQAGQPLFASVRVENLGDNTESSVKVTVAVPALGIQTSEYVDKLLTLQDEDDDEDRDADDAATTNDLLLMIPENAQEGDYSVVVMVEYNRGRNVEQRTFTMHVRGAQLVPETETPAETTVVSVDSNAVRVNQGEGAVFKFTVANLGQQAGSFTFDVVGVNDWANTRVDPTTLVVQPDSTSDAYVFVAPSEDVVGIRTFTVRVMSGNELVAEENLSLEVVEAEGTDAKNVLTWIFVVLLIILVVLAVVVLVRKLAMKEEEKGIEGQTYY